MLVRASVALIIGILAATVQASPWRQLATGAAEPPACMLAAAVYEPTSHRVLVYGGRGSGRELGDLWEVDLAQELWHQITWAGEAPETGPWLCTTRSTTA